MEAIVKAMGIRSINSKEGYDNLRNALEALIYEADKMKLLDNPMDNNEYVREIARLAKLSADYEDNVLKITPL